MLATSGHSNTDAQEFIEASRLFLKADFLPKIDYCLHEMSEEDVWWRPNEQSNSVGNLVLHLCGNLREWILNALDSGNFDRDRDAEFSSRGPVPKDELSVLIAETVGRVDGVLDRLAPVGLLERLPIQTYTTSRLQAIYHVVEHFSYHLGQILFICKLRTGKDPGFRRNLAL